MTKLFHLIFPLAASALNSPVSVCRSKSKHYLDDRVLPSGGFEDHMHCPKGSCTVYNYNAEIPGMRSDFFKCYDMAGDKDPTEAVWTGSDSLVLPPAGWVEDPEECWMEKVGDKNVDIPGGMCMNDSDCHTVIRSAASSRGASYDNHGVAVNNEYVALCECYAASDRFTFDETEGQGEKDVIRAKCAADACDGYEAYCLAPNDNCMGMAACALRPVKSIVSPTPAVVE
jgi:hypothetical protein